MNNTNQDTAAAPVETTAAPARRPARPRSPAFCATQQDAYSMSIVNAIYAVTPPVDTLHPKPTASQSLSPRQTRRRPQG